jgi:uncharacterized protein YjbI with pentapeptide repeats
MNSTKNCCQYTDPEGHCCPNLIEYGNYCYWHDQALDKSQDNIKEKLEQYAKSGGFLHGLSLKKTQLAGIDLVHHHSNNGYDFSYSDFYRANLNNAHLFNSILNNSSLMKADLRDANLHRTKLNNANLLGVRWQGSKIEKIQLGDKLLQQKLAKTAYKNDDSEAATDYLEQAEEIYRDLRKHSEQEGMFTLSGQLIQKELTMRRLQLPRYSSQRFFSKLVDIFCGYGEAPLRIIGISIVLIICCAFIYMFTGLNFAGEIQTLEADLSFEQNSEIFFSSLYYSVVTFTTLGYGDYTPVGISRAVAAFEAFTGSFTIALFVVVFVKKMTR